VAPPGGMKATPFQRRRRGPLEAVDCKLHESDFVRQVLSAVRAAYFSGEVSAVPLPIPISLTSPKIAIAWDGRTFIAKFPPTYRDDMARYEHILELGCRIGERVPELVRPIRGRDGHLLQSCDSRRFWLSEFIPSSSFNGLRDEALSAACVLARFHAAAATATKAPTGVQVAFSTSQNTCHFFINMVRETAACSEDIELAEVFEYLVNCALSRSDWTDGTALLHGDPTIQNFCFADCSTVGLCDLDDMASGYVERDLGTLVVSACGIRYAGRTSSLAPDPCIGFNLPLADAMIEHYLSAGGRACRSRVMEEVVLLWIELMCLGIVRCDFPASAVLVTAPVWLGTVANDLPDGSLQTAALAISTGALYGR
jgi:Phosphotransferase enzyme family